MNKLFQLHIGLTIIVKKCIFNGQIVLLSSKHKKIINRSFAIE